jgi:hypothetical protein
MNNMEIVPQDFKSGMGKRKHPTERELRRRAKELGVYFHRQNVSGPRHLWHYEITEHERRLVWPDENQYFQIPSWGEVLFGADSLEEVAEFLERFGHKETVQ